MESTPATPLRVTSDRSPRRRVAGVLSLAVGALALSGCSLPAFGGYKSDTKQGVSTFHLWQWFTIGAIAVGAFVLILITWAVIRYRQKGDELPKQTQYHLPLEITYTVIPILIVIGLFVGTVAVENQVVANPTTSVVVDVSAHQWGWTFQYPTTNAVVSGETTSSPMFEIPVNTNVSFNLSSTDVIHGFYIREFNFSRYAQPGIVNQFSFNAVHTGIFFGQCSQICGLQHSLMWFRVKVVPRLQYDAWIASFNTVAGARAAEAAALANQQQTSSITPTRPTPGSGTGIGK